MSHYVPLNSAFTLFVSFPHPLATSCSESVEELGGDLEECWDGGRGGCYQREMWQIVNKGGRRLQPLGWGGCSRDHSCLPLGGTELRRSRQVVTPERWWGAQA